MRYLVFAIHNHQPVGNFHHVIENSFEKAYRPLLERLAARASIKAVVHISGYLLDWIEKRRPDYIDLIKEMVERAQIELLGGGYYEPVLSVIPPEDRVSQIRLMNRRLATLFGTRPRGMWLAERVWDPALPSSLKEAGIEYVVVDDHHFIRAGMEEEDVRGYYVTEDLGAAVRVFGGSQRLRYLIPFEKLPKLEAYLKGREGLSVFADDGEKFGIWPGTERLVYQEGWLEGFFHWLEENSQWIKTTTFSEYMDSVPPMGKIYLPPVSYMEMEEWALSAKTSAEYARLRKEFEEARREDVLNFLQGGYWRNFLSKYPEADWMHKRMLLLSRKVNSMECPPEEALVCLYRAQCNDAYWHGVFGGLYLPHLRFSVYENIIRAEELIEGQEGLTIEAEDVDGDLSEELIVKTPKMSLFFAPHRGGSLVEMDLKEFGVNILNVLSRWQEGYHLGLAHRAGSKSDGEVKSIHHEIKVKRGVKTEGLLFDRLRRVSMVESLLPEGVGAAEYHAGREPVERLWTKRYRYSKMEDGLVFETDCRQGRLKKKVAVEDAEALRFTYSMVDPEAVEEEGRRVAIEWNLCLPCGCGPDGLYRVGKRAMSLGSSAELEGAEGLSVEDRGRGLSVGFYFHRPLTVWLKPIETVSLSESGLERNYQGSTVVLVVPLGYILGTEFSILMRIEKL